MSPDTVQWLQGHVSVLIVAGGAVAGALRFAPRFFLELVVALTKNQERRLACLEAIRLRRKDASTLPSYLPPPATRPRSGAEPVSASPRRSTAGRKRRRPKQGARPTAAGREPTAGV